jgi:15-cis-phytoene synthase
VNNSQALSQHDQYAQDKAAKAGSSFYYSFLFLPPAQRREITAFYAFCREVDDIADEIKERDVARAKLAWWRTEVADLFAGRPHHPVSHALTPAIQRGSVERGDMDEMINGMEMDVDHRRYRDFDALKVYCHRVAGVVGLGAARIFGFSNPQTLRYAETLGLAFQLTNIIRDVGEDARNGRIYLPQDELARFGVAESDLLECKYSDAFRELMRFQYDRAQATYEAAFALLPKEDRKAQRVGLMMAAIYRTVLREIEREQFAVLHQRIALTPIRKLWLAWKTWVFN